MGKKLTFVFAGATAVLATMAGVVTLFDFAEIAPVARAINELEAVSLTLGTEALVAIAMFFAVSNALSILVGTQIAKSKTLKLLSRLHMLIHHMRDAIGQHSIRMFIPGFSHEVLCNQFERCMITATESIRSAASVFLEDCSCTVSFTDGSESISYHFRDKESRDKVRNGLKDAFSLSTAMIDIEENKIEPPLVTVNNIAKTNSDFVDATLSNPAEQYSSSLTVAIRVNIDRDLLAGKLTTRRHIEHHIIGYVTIETQKPAIDNPAVEEVVKLAADALAQTVFTFARKEYEVAPNAECPFSRVLHHFFKDVESKAA